MGAPGDLADGVVVAVQEGQGRGGVADVEGADDAVDAGGGDEVGAVLVPVVGEGLAGLEGGAVGAERGDLARRLGEGRVDRDAGDEVVGGGGGGAQVEDPQVRVGGDGGEDRGGVRGEGGGVGAGMCGEGGEGLGAVGGPLLDVSSALCRRDFVCRRGSGTGEGGARS